MCPVKADSGQKLYLKQSVNVEYCLYLYLCADLVQVKSLCQVVCGWYNNQFAQNFVENSQLQCACFMQLPAEIVNHVHAAAGVLYLSVTNRADLLRTIGLHCAFKMHGCRNFHQAYFFSRCTRMASDKRKTGYTLTEKCQDEEDKLRKKLAEDLKQDMKRFVKGCTRNLGIVSLEKHV